MALLRHGNQRKSLTYLSKDRILELVLVLVDVISTPGHHRFQSLTISLDSAPTYAFVPASQVSILLLSIQNCSHVFQTVVTNNPLCL